MRSHSRHRSATCDGFTAAVPLSPATAGDTERLSSVTPRLPRLIKLVVALPVDVSLILLPRMRDAVALEVDLLGGAALRASTRPIMAHGCIFSRIRSGVKLQSPRIHVKVSLMPPATAPKRMTLRLPETLARKLSKAAREERRSQNLLIVVALEEWLAARNGKA